MRKLLMLLMVLVLSFGLVACGGDSGEEVPLEEEEPIEEADSTVDVEEEEEIEEIEEEKEVEPEPIPEPIIYEGSGDDVIDIEKTEEGPIILYIEGNQGGGHFAVKGFASDDKSTELFVNTTDSYSGTTLDPSGETILLEISSNGSWRIESQSARSMRMVESPGMIEGTGDEVVLVQGNTSKANITGNAAGSHFAVRGYNPSSNLLVNTTDVYEGTVRMDSDTFLLEITAVGDWSIDLE